MLKTHWRLQSKCKRSVALEHFIRKMQRMEKNSILFYFIGSHILSRIECPLLNTPTLLTGWLETFIRALMHLNGWLVFGANNGHRSQKHTSHHQIHKWDMFYSVTSYRFYTYAPAHALIRTNNGEFPFVCLSMPRRVSLTASVYSIRQLYVTPYGSTYALVPKSVMRMAYIWMDACKYTRVYASCIVNMLSCCIQFPIMQICI